MSMGDNIVVTLYSNRVTSEPNNPHLSRPALGCLAFSTGSSNSSTSLHRGDGSGKVIFSLVEVGKTSVRPFRAKCLNHFVGMC